jgi:hypothetical protein
MYKQNTYVCIYVCMYLLLECYTASFVGILFTKYVIYLLTYLPTLFSPVLVPYLVAISFASFNIRILLTISFASFLRRYFFAYHFSLVSPVASLPPSI